MLSLLIDLRPTRRSRTFSNRLRHRLRLFAAISRTARLELDFRYAEVDANLVDIADTKPSSSGRNAAYDISRITSDTGWRPGHLEDAFGDYHGWLKTHDV